MNKSYGKTKAAISRHHDWMEIEEDKMIGEREIISSTKCIYLLINPKICRLE